MKQSISWSMALVDVEIGGLSKGAGRMRDKRRSNDWDLERLARSIQSSLVNDSFVTWQRHLSDSDLS
jgi:hypothetical protein